MEGHVFPSTSHSKDKVTTSLFRSKSAVAAFKNMIMTYLQQGGPQIQVNVVTPEELADAKMHPDKHRNLVVRVAGFCEYFVNLDDKMQNEIISRTSYETI